MNQVEPYSGMPRRRLLGLATSFLLVSACGATPPPADASGVGGAAGGPSVGSQGSPVVDAEWVEQNLAGVVPVDVRSRAEYDAGHLPGAVFLDAAALRATVDGVSGQVAPLSKLEAAFTEAGLSPESEVVVYGADTSTNPARVFWTFEYAGHEAVYFLDGGAAAWGARSTTTDVPRKAAEPYVIASPRLHLWKGKDDVKAAIAAGGVSLVDARSSGEFVGGHIQGALSLDWNLALAGGALRPHDELTALYSGIESGVPIINYCQTGARASVNYLVQRHLGRADVSVYDGSWSEWSSLDSSEYPREPAP